MDLRIGSINARGSGDRTQRHMTPPAYDADLKGNRFGSAICPRLSAMKAASSTTDGRTSFIEASDKVAFCRLIFPYLFSCRKAC